MKKLLLSPILAILALGLTSCSHVPVVGAVYTDVAYPQSATGNPAGNRVGEACARSILGIAAWGDASIETARRNGGITMISSVDQEQHTVLGVIYNRSCTIVRGR
jgi:hypothetical protein